MDRDQPIPLRIFIANEREDHLLRIAEMVQALGHAVVGTSVDVSRVGDLTSREHPDVALVGLGDSTQHALDLIERIVGEASCPVIAMLAGRDPAFIDRAAKLGIFAYVTDGRSAELQGALDITLSRFREYHTLEGAFGRRATVERAKGIVMERHRVDEQHAFALLREQSRHTGRKLVDIAQGVVDGFSLLPRDAAVPPGRRAPDDLVSADRPV